MSSNRKRRATILDHGRNAAYDPDFGAPYSLANGELLPQRHTTGAVEVLERLRAELRIVVPVLYVRLLTPNNEPPTLHTVRGSNDDRVEIDPDSDGRYRWRSTGEDIGHPDQAREAALSVAAAMDAPVRTPR